MLHDVIMKWPVPGCIGFELVSQETRLIVAQLWVSHFSFSFNAKSTILSRLFEADYQAPIPPAFTGPHQYIFLLYKSTIGDVPFDEGPIPVTDFARRRLFRLKEFEIDHQLQLVAATSFTVSG